MTRGCLLVDEEEKLVNGKKRRRRRFPLMDRIMENRKYIETKRSAQDRYEWRAAITKPAS